MVKTVADEGAASPSSCTWTTAPPGSRMSSACGPGFTSLMYDGSKEPFEVNVREHQEHRRHGPRPAASPWRAELGLIPKIEELLTTEEACAPSSRAPAPTSTNC